MDIDRIAAAGAEVIAISVDSRRAQRSDVLAVAHAERPVRVRPPAARPISGRWSCSIPDERGGIALPALLVLDRRRATKVFGYRGADFADRRRRTTMSSKRSRALESRMQSTHGRRRPGGRRCRRRIRRAPSRPRSSAPYFIGNKFAANRHPAHAPTARTRRNLREEHQLMAEGNARSLGHRQRLTDRRLERIRNRGCCRASSGGALNGASSSISNRLIVGLVGLVHLLQVLLQRCASRRDVVAFHADRAAERVLGLAHALFAGGLLLVH